MGILDFFGNSKNKDSKYKGIHKQIVNHYKVYSSGNTDEYSKSRITKESAERELFSLLGKDENVIKLITKYNLTIKDLEEIYNRIIEEGGGQVVKGKFIPILAMTDIDTLSYLIQNLSLKDLSKNNDDTYKIVAKVVNHYLYAEDL